MHRILCTAVLIAAIAGTPASAASRASVAVVDGVGDATWNAADIRSVSIADDEGGKLILALDLVNRHRGLRPDDFVHIYFDSDESLLTGIEGFDYAIEADGGDETAALYRWDGRHWAYLDATTLGASASGQQLWLNARELDSTTAFRAFFETNLHSDPDAHDRLGPVRFTPSPGQPLAPELRVVSLTSQPSPPRTGKSLVVQVVVERADLGEVLTHGTIRCSATIGAKTLRTAWRPHFFEIIGAAVFGERSSAMCGWNIPRGSRGRMMDGSVTIVADRLQVRQPFALRIR